MKSTSLIILTLCMLVLGCEGPPTSRPQVQQPSRARVQKIPAPKSHSVEGIIQALKKDPESEPGYLVWYLTLARPTDEDVYQISCTRDTPVERDGLYGSISDLRVGQKVKVTCDTYSWVPITNDQVGELITVHVPKRIVVVQDVQP